MATRPDSAEYARLMGHGLNSIVGQAFLMTRGGDVRLGAGRPVTLDPLTSYSNEWYRRFGADLSRFNESPADSIFLRARRKDVVDAQGNFSFKNLPDGTYLLRGIVTWEAGVGDFQGGVVADTVTVRGGEERKIILNTVVTPEAPLPIPILNAAQASGRQFTTLGSVQGRSCKRSALGPAPSETNARSELSLNAAKLGAAAIIDVECEKQGVSLTANCTSSILCRGKAVK